MSDIELSLQTIMLFELDRMTTECGEIKVLMNMRLWETDSEIEKTFGCFKAAPGQLGLIKFYQWETLHHSLSNSTGRPVVSAGYFCLQN